MPTGSRAGMGADEPRAVLRRGVDDAVVDVRRETRGHRNGGKAVRAEQRPRVRLPAVRRGLDRRAELRGRNVARRIGHGIEVEHRHALQRDLLQREAVGQAIADVERQIFVRVLEPFLLVGEARVGPNVDEERRLRDQVVDGADARVAALARDRDSSRTCARRRCRPRPGRGSSGPRESRRGGAQIDEQRHVVGGRLAGGVDGEQLRLLPNE